MNIDSNTKKKSILSQQAEMFFRNTLPAQLNSDQIAWLLNIPTSIVGPLAHAGLIDVLGGKPVGKRRTDLVVRTATILSYATDLKRLEKITAFCRQSRR